VFNLPVRAAHALALVALASFVNAAETPTTDEPAAAQARGAPAHAYNSESAREFSADRFKVTFERLPNGTRVYHMNGQGMQSVTAHVDANGKLDFACSDRNGAPAVGDPPGDAAPNVGAGQSNAHER
jgi:hypothetical protein